MTGRPTTGSLPKAAVLASLPYALPLKTGEQLLKIRQALFEQLDGRLTADAVVRPDGSIGYQVRAAPPPSPAPPGASLALIPEEADEDAEGEEEEEEDDDGVTPAADAGVRRNSRTGGGLRHRRGSSIAIDDTSPTFGERRESPEVRRSRSLEASTLVSPVSSPLPSSPVHHSAHHSHSLPRRHRQPIPFPGLDKEAGPTTEVLPPTPWHAIAHINYSSLFGSAAGLRDGDATAVLVELCAQYEADVRRGEDALASHLSGVARRTGLGLFSRGAQEVQTELERWARSKGFAPHVALGIPPHEPVTGDHILGTPPADQEHESQRNHDQPAATKVGRSAGSAKASRLGRPQQQQQQLTLGGIGRRSSTTSTFNGGGSPTAAATTAVATVDPPSRPTRSSKRKAEDPAVLLHRALEDLDEALPTLKGVQRAECFAKVLLSGLGRAVGGSAAALHAPRERDGGLPRVAAWKLVPEFTGRGFEAAVNAAFAQRGTLDALSGYSASAGEDEERARAESDPIPAPPSTVGLEVGPVVQSIQRHLPISGAFLLRCAVGSFVAPPVVFMAYAEAYTSGLSLAASLHYDAPPPPPPPPLKGAATATAVAAVGSSPTGPRGRPR